MRTAATPRRRDVLTAREGLRLALNLPWWAAVIAYDLACAGIRVAIVDPAVKAMGLDRAEAAVRSRTGELRARLRAPSGQRRRSSSAGRVPQAKRR